MGLLCKFSSFLFLSLSFFPANLICPKSDNDNDNDDDDDSRQQSPLLFSMHWSGFDEIDHVEQLR